MAAKKQTKKGTKKAVSRSAQKGSLTKTKKNQIQREMMPTPEVVSRAQIKWAMWLTSEMAMIVAGISVVVIAAGFGIFWYVKNNTDTLPSSETEQSMTNDESDKSSIDDSTLGVVQLPPIRSYVGTQKQAIVAQLAARIKQKPEEITARILSFSNSHAFGEYSVAVGEDVAASSQLDNFFYAVSFNNVWTVHYANEGRPSCSLLKQYVFPEDMTIGCRTEIENTRWSQESEDAVVKTLDAKYADREDYFGASIDLIQGDFARGTVEFEEEATHQFFARKQNDRWIVVSDSSEPFDCKKLASEGLPETLYGSSCFAEYELIRPTE